MKCKWVDDLRVKDGTPFVRARSVAKEVYDVRVAFFHADIDEGVVVLPPSGGAEARLCLATREGHVRHQEGGPVVTGVRRGRVQEDRLEADRGRVGGVLRALTGHDDGRTR